MSGDPPQRSQDLEALFERWDQRKLEEGGIAPPGEMEAPEDVVGGMRFQVDKVRMWVTLTLLVFFLSGWMMWQTRHEVSYWLERGQAPMELGDLRERYRDGARELDVPTNRFVHASGLFTTHESEAETEAGGEIVRFYLEPMFGIVVKTPRPFPDKPFHRTASIEIEEDFVPILQARRAFPYDLAVTVEATGRLVRATEAPRWHLAPLHHFARRTDREVESLWLLIEGDRPEAHVRFVFLWFGSVVMCCMALFLLWRTWSERRAERAA